MSFIFDANGTIPNTGAAAVFRLKELLKSAGWIVVQSSDGTTYNSGADVISSGSAAGAGSMRNARAWFEIKQPAPGTRHFVFQCSTAAPGDGSLWRVKYSPILGFTQAPIGSPPALVPTATITPSAIDEIILVGGGNDVNPTFTNLLPADGGYRMNAIANDVAGSSSFFLFTNISATAYIETAFFLDELAQAAPGDTNAAVLYLTTAPGDQVMNAGLLNGDASVYKAGVLEPTFALSLREGAHVLFPGGGPPNPTTSKDDFVPIPYGVPTASTGGTKGWKGISTMFQWAATIRSHGQAYLVSAPNDRIQITGDSTGAASYVVIPWDGSALVL